MQNRVARGKKSVERRADNKSVCARFIARPTEDKGEKECLTFGERGEVETNHWSFFFAINSKKKATPAPALRKQHHAQLVFAMSRAKRGKGRRGGGGSDMQMGEGGKSSRARSLVSSRPST